MQFRNIAIIAHVDHGKTTLVDKMLHQAGVFGAHQHVDDRVMDSSPLEKERGITILSKNASLNWKGVKINVVDTPGHADFGGEVERILRMVDGVLLLVDAVEGPMPQTRFVTRKALELGVQPIVVINKTDRPEARAEWVHDEVLELFMDLEASEAQLDAPFLYGSARDGHISRSVEGESSDLTPLFDAIIESVPGPQGDKEGPFQMLISTIEHSQYVGRLGIGRIERGKVVPGQRVTVMPIGRPGIVKDELVMTGKVVKVMSYQGLTKVELDEAVAGDIVAVAGLEGIEIGRTMADPDTPERMKGIAVEEPTISVDFLVNNSPFAGQSGKFVTTRQVRDRLFKELDRNVALKVEDTETPEVIKVSGRGELHLSILMETMRREGYEFQVSRPKVIMKKDDNGKTLEPYEELTIDVPENHVGTVMEGLGPRKAEMLDMVNHGGGMVRINFKIPARGLFGYRSDFLTDTRGEGIMHHRFAEYGQWAGELGGRKQGVLVADRQGQAVGFAIFGLQERSVMFVSPGIPVYEGMVVGENSRPGDMDVNICREKKLTNMRTHAADDMIKLETPREITLEVALEYIEDDELIEITPNSVRLRKRHLSAIERKKSMRAAKRA